MQKIIQSKTIKHLFITPLLHQRPEYENLEKTVQSLHKLEETFLLEHWTLKEQ